MRDLFCKSGVMLLRSVGLVAFCLLCLACGFQPRWTPESVAPPASLEKALAQADLTRLAGRSALGEDKVTTLSLTRDGAILTMLARNRSLAVQRFAPELSALSIEQARAAFDPDLLASVSYSRSVSPGSPLASRSVAGSAQITEAAPTGTDVTLSGNLSRGRAGSADWQSAGSWSAGINQSLLRGVGLDVNLVTLRQARNSAARSTHELRGFVLGLVQQVENAYWDLVLARETLGIRVFSLQLSREQLQLNYDRIGVGSLSPDAIFSAEADLASREADLVDARAAVRTRTIDLIRLLDPDAPAQWSIQFNPADAPVVAEVDLIADVSASLAGLYRPEIAQSRLDLANRDLEVVRTRNGLLPRLDAFANYGLSSAGSSIGDATQHLGDGEYPDYQVGLQFEMAPLNRAERARDRGARFQQQQAEAALRNLEQQVESEVRRTAIEVQRQWQRIPATRQALKSQQEALLAEQNRFALGKSTNLDVQQVHRDLVQAQLDEATARIRYIEAITALYHAEGTLLDRRGIGVEKAAMIPEEKKQ